VRPEKLVSIDYTPHAAECDGPHCNTRGDPVLPYAIQPTECHDVMVVNHYFTKSREDWLAKVRRGKADAHDQKANPYNPRVLSDVAGASTTEDFGALRFLPRLRTLLPS
jgi:hypothetical protein